MHHIAYSSHRGGYPSYLQRLLRVILLCSIIHNEKREKRRLRSTTRLMHHPTHPRPKVLGSTL